MTDIKICGEIWQKFGKSISLASYQVDVIVVQGGACQEGTVWVEWGARDRWGAGVVQEARVRLKSGKMSAVDIEGLDFMTVGTPWPCVSV